MSDQSSETIIVNGERLILDWAYPLEDYLYDHPELVGPARHRRITTRSTSENRGYDGTWEIKNNGLYLVDIYSEFIKYKGFWFWKKLHFETVTIAKLFPEAINNEIKATWFSGAFSAYTRKYIKWQVLNPVKDMLRVSFENGNLKRYQWYHLEEKDGKKEKVPYDRVL